MAFDHLLGFFLTVILQFTLLPIIWCIFKSHKPNQRTPHDFYYRILSLWMYFSFYLWLIFLLVCETLKRCHSKLSYVALCALGFAFIVVLIESGFSRELKYISGLSADETVWQYIKKQQPIPPKIRISVECYHYEEYERTGTHVSSSFTETERVSTFTETEEFPYASWVDVSERESQEQCTAPVAKVTINPCFVFGNQETLNDYTRAAVTMVERNRNRDEHIDFSIGVEIPEMREKFLGYVDLGMKQFWMRPLYFWIATLLQMTWPYRFLFKAHTGKIHDTLKKKIYKVFTYLNEEGPTDAPIANLAIDSGYWTMVSSNLGRYSLPLSQMSNPVFAPYPPLPSMAGTSNAVLSNNTATYPPTFTPKSTTVSLSLPHQP